VHVTLQPSVLDAEGQAIHRALADVLGFKEVHGVRCGKIFEFELDTEDEAEARLAVEDVCKKELVTHPGMYTYEIVSVN